MCVGVREIEGATTECVTSTLTDGKHIFSSGGYPRNHLSAVLADGSGQIAWETKDRVYVPSLLVRQGHLFGVLDAGVEERIRSEIERELADALAAAEAHGAPRSAQIFDHVYAEEPPRVTEQRRASEQGD